MAAECALIVVRKGANPPAERPTPSIDVDQGAPINRKRHPGDEIGLVGG